MERNLTYKQKEKELKKSKEGFYKKEVAHSVKEYNIPRIELIEKFYKYIIKNKHLFDIYDIRFSHMSVILNKISNDEKSMIGYYGKNDYRWMIGGGESNNNKSEILEFKTLDEILKEFGKSK